MKRTGKQYAGGVIHRRGRAYEASYSRAGERFRRSFGTEIEACRWLDVETGRADPMSSDDMRDAHAALAILPEGVTLADAARYYVRHNIAAPLPLDKALSLWLSAKRTSCRPATLKGYESVADWISARTEGETVADITPDRLAELLATKGPASRNLYLRTVSSLFGWLIRTGKAKENPVEGVEFARLDRPRRSIVTVSQAEALLAAAEEVDGALALCFAVGLFAGIRPYELERLSWSNFSNGYIILDAAITKTASERTVEIQPNLLEWIRVYGDGSVRGAPFHGLTRQQIRRRRDKVWLKVQGMEGKSKTDILRHSYASYMYELTGDAQLVASSMGHRDTGMLFKHYRGLAVPGSGRRFFGILPRRKAGIRPDLLMRNIESVRENMTQT